ncbi:saccharopine dehydrogenase, partial [Enterococcus faecalis]
DNNIFVLSSGYFPGLSGIMASYACSRLKNVDSISGFNVSEEIPSKSAIEDFVLTNLSGFGKALYYYKNGELVYEDGIK